MPADNGLHDARSCRSFPVSGASRIGCRVGRKPAIRRFLVILFIRRACSTQLRIASAPSRSSFSCSVACFAPRSPGSSSTTSIPGKRCRTSGSVPQRRGREDGDRERAPARNRSPNGPELRLLQRPVRSGDRRTQTFENPLAHHSTGTGHQDVVSKMVVRHRKSRHTADLKSQRLERD